MTMDPKGKDIFRDELYGDIEVKRQNPYLRARSCLELRLFENRKRCVATCIPDRLSISPNPQGSTETESGLRVQN